MAGPSACPNVIEHWDTSGHFFVPPLQPFILAASRGAYFFTLSQWCPDVPSIVYFLYDFAPTQEPYPAVFRFRCFSESCPLKPANPAPILGYRLSQCVRTLGQHRDTKNCPSLAKKWVQKSPKNLTPRVSISLFFRILSAKTCEPHVVTGLQTVPMCPDIGTTSGHTKKPPNLAAYPRVSISLFSLLPFTPSFQPRAKRGLETVPTCADIGTTSGH